MPKIFISHSVKDNDIARKLNEYLKKDGAETWIYFSDISPGTFFIDEIEKGIEWCDVLILLWSESAKNRKFVKIEWNIALNSDKQIIPCIIDNTELPKTLAILQDINFKNFEQGYNKLLQAIKISVKEKDEKSILKKSVKDIILPPRFRGFPAILSFEELEEIIIKFDFFDKGLNRKGKGVDHLYEIQLHNSVKLIIDRKTGLAWQRDGSDDSLEHDEAENEIVKLKGKNYAGYYDWRLPTLVEAMSLMENTKNVDGLFINEMFDKKQEFIWTSDFGTNRYNWIVYYNKGFCSVDPDDEKQAYIRAVRSVL